MKPIILLKLIGTVLIAVLIELVATHPAFLAITGTDYILFTTLLGVVLIHLRLNPKLADVAVLVAGTSVLCLLAPRPQALGGHPRRASHGFHLDCAVAAHTVTVLGLPGDSMGHGYCHRYGNGMVEAKALADG